ncbi:MAG TPA: hypothetical protein VGJ20_30870 [Xanthobacteraceae bacterium]|jgi:hypothetical protein
MCRDDTWQHIAAELDKAARGADPIDVAVALQLVLMFKPKHALRTS